MPPVAPNFTSYLLHLLHERSERTAAVSNRLDYVCVHLKTSYSIWM